MNRLRHALSPYLLQHADQPVDWHAWDAEALTRARTEDKPILLSIGYSACHWCHVMAHESFADPAIAATMNRLFVNIKVDREERPDLDKIYQAAHQLLTRARGGWPLTMFLDPSDHVPFFGGTYFPPQARYGRPGFAELLERVAAAYRTQRTDLPAFKHRLRSALANMLDAAPNAGDEADPIAVACTALASQYDTSHGGFGGAPKFPQPFALELLLAAGSGEHVAMAEHCLRAMAAGGLRDHLTGGFFRYATDVDWTIPHFEKMLYDNAALLALYTDAWVRTGDAAAREVIDSTAQWLQHTMQLADGGYAASLDADAEGGEGAYYVWRREEIEGALAAW